MPGIAGVISRQPRQRCEATVRAMVASMSHDPAYVSGVHCDPDMSVYVGWVSHAAPRRPFQRCAARDAEIALVLGDGIVSSPSDMTSAPNEHDPVSRVAESLATDYRAHGERAFRSVNGLLSGVLIDRRQRRTFVFNDPHGVDRIYYGETNDGVYFASEAKALLRVVPEFRALDTDGVADVAAFGCLLDGRTLFRGIRWLPSGSLWLFENGEHHKSRYVSVEKLEQHEPMSAADFDAAFQREFMATVQEHCRGQQRIGLSLTGGIDSRMVVACRPNDAAETICYTFSGLDGNTRDVRLAAAVASKCGLPHETIHLGQNFLKEFGTFADRTVFVTDGNYGISGAHEIHLNERAKALAPVRLGGVFGGELLRGVSTLKRLTLSRQIFDATFLKAVVQAEERWQIGRGHPITNAAFTEVPWSLFGSLAACRSQVTLRAPYLDNRIVSLAYLCPSALRRSSDAGLRMIHANRPSLSAVPTDRGHLHGASAIRTLVPRLWSETTFKLDYLSNEGLPGVLSCADRALDYLHAKRVLFGDHKYLRYRRWFRKELAGYIHDSLRAARDSPWWNRKVLDTLSDAHIKGKANYVEEIATVLTMDAVERLLIRNPQATY